MTRACVAMIVAAASLSVLIAGALVLAAAGRSGAVQNPTVSVDMVTTFNTFDYTTNVMSVGTIEACFTTDPPGNASTHSHFVQLIIENVEDLIGWSARFNYLGDKMRIASVDATPFLDLNREQFVGFPNLPTEGSSGHRGVATSSSIPAAPQISARRL